MSRYLYVRTGGLVFFFFFQAEDGIRDLIVTGVQTCALPILDHQIADELRLVLGQRVAPGLWARPGRRAVLRRDSNFLARFDAIAGHRPLAQIGRASGRGRVEISGGAVSFKKKKKETRED